MGTRTDGSADEAVEDAASDVSSSESSYAGSEASVDSAADPGVRVVAGRIEQSFSTIALDRALVSQAQLSGLLNSRTRELAGLQKQVEDRLPKVREDVVHAKKIVRQISADLDWLRRKLKPLESRTRAKHPIEYVKAREKLQPAMGSSTNCTKRSN